jgi:hypothetical protein
MRPPLHDVKREHHHHSQNRPQRGNSTHHPPIKRSAMPPADKERPLQQNKALVRNIAIIMCILMLIFAYLRFG